MSKQLTPAQLRALEPRYTIGGLFESGTLYAGDEFAMAEIASIRNSFARLVNPSRGWFSPRGGGGGSSVPRTLASGQIWKRYVAWRRRWSRLVVAPSPSLPWGMTAADLVVWLVTEPVTFHQAAELAGRSGLSVVRLFVEAIHDYGQDLDRSRNAFWREWDGLPAKDARSRQRKARTNAAARQAGFRRRKRSKK